MAPSRVALVLLFLVLVPGLGHSQSREEPWSEFPGALPPPPLTPAEESSAEQPPPPPAEPAPFEPEGFPEREPSVASEVPAPPAAPVEEAASAPGPREEDPSQPVYLPGAVAPLQPGFDPARSGLSFETEPLAVPLVRGLLEISGGTAVTLGHMVLVELATGTNCFEDTDGCALTAFLVTFVGAAAAPLGASAVGAVMGGEGKLWAAYLGAAIGLGVGVITTIPTIAFDHGTVLAVAGPIGAIIGSAIGYELSHRRARRGGSLFAGQRGPGVRMVPVVGATAHGGLVGGMVGSF